MSDLADALTYTLRAAPELGTQPGLAYGVAASAAQTGSDPTQMAQASAQASSTYAQDQAVQNTGAAVGHPNLLHQTLGWLGGAAHAVNQATGGVIGDAFHSLGGPLREVQHQFRYLHDVEARHGPVPALLEALGIAAGAGVVGYLSGSADAAKLAGEGVAEAEGHLFYKDSYARTSSGANYQGAFNRQSGEYSGPAGQVSVGRDITGAVGLKPGSKPATFISGAADALADLTFDPVAAAGGLHADMVSPEGLADSPVSAIADRFPGTRFVTPEDVDKAVAAYPQVQRGMQQLADATTEQLTSSRKWAPFAAQLGPAHTVDEVAQVFKDNIDVARTVSSTLPTSTIVGGVARQASQAVQNYEGVGSNAIRSATSFLPTAFDPETLKLSGREFDPAADDSIHGVYQVARMSMTKTASEMLAGEYANATPGDRIGIYKNVLLKMFAARGLETDTPEIRQQLEQLMGGSAPGFDAKYGTDALGRDLSQLPATDTQAGSSAAISLSQTGKLAYPNFSEVTRLTRDAAAEDGGLLGKARGLYGAADDFVYKDFTQNIFKRLALLSGGFAQRIAMAEAIPAIAREGFTTLVKNRLASTAAKLGYDAMAEPEEASRVAGIVWNLSKGVNDLRQGAGKLLTSPETVGDFTDMVTSLDGARVPAAVDTTTHYSGEIGGAAVKAERDVKAAASLVPQGQQYGDKFMTFGNGDRAFDQAWAQKLSMISKDPLHQVAAGAYLDAINPSAPLSAVVDEGGQPLRVFHGTGAAFDKMAADGGQGLYFTDEANATRYANQGAVLNDGTPNVRSAYLDIRNPAPLTPRETASLTPERIAGLKDEGYDGVVSTQGGHPVYVAFDPEQVHDVATPEQATKAGADAVTKHLQAMQSGEVTPGLIVHASDRANIGRVMSIDAEQNTAVVHFVNRTEGTQADVTLPLSRLSSSVKKSLSLYQRATRASVEGADPLEDWGRVVMADLRGATHSPDTVDAAGQLTQPGTPHTDLLRNVSDGTQTPMSALEGIDPALKPAHVEGRQLIDIPHQNLLQRISNFGFSRVLDPIINTLSREPLYANEWLKEYQPFKPLIESGDIDKGQAIQEAHVRAVKNMVPFIHNTLERSQFAELAHNYMPFFFAQQQAFARYGRILADDPGAFRQLQLATTGLSNTAAQTKDPNGNSWMVYPGLGFLTGGTIKALGAFGVPVAGSVPISYSGQVASLNTVFPLADVAPKFGPVVAIAGHLLENRFPEMQPAVTKVIGGAANSGGVWGQLIPNTTIKGFIAAFGDEHKRAFASSMMSTLQNLAYQQQVAEDKWTAGGQVGPKPQIVPDDNAGPQIQQQFNDRVKNQTRIAFVMKAIIGAVTPTAVTPNVGDLVKDQQLRDAITKDGVALGTQKFLAANPDATPLTVYQSDSPLGSGAVLPSQAAETFYNDHQGYLKQFPYAGVWLLPQVSDPNFNQSIYNEQLAQGLRQKRSPEQFYTQLQIAQGDAQFFGTSPVDYTDQLKKLNTAQASPSAFQSLQTQVMADSKAGDYARYQVALAAARANGGDTTTLQSNWSAYLQTQAKANPVWYDDFTSNTRTNERTLAANQLVDMFTQGAKVPDGPQTADLRELVNDYQTYQQAIVSGRQDSYAVASRATLKARWQSYVTQLAAQKPNLAPVIDHVFRSL